MKSIRINSLVAIALLLVTVSACRKKDVPPPDNVAQFEIEEQGIGETEDDKTVTIRLSAAVNTTVPILITMTPSPGLIYGTHYTTTPEATGNEINLDLLSGNREVSFTINKIAGAAFVGDENIVFKISSTTSSVIIGSGNEFKLTFAEIVSTGSAMIGNGGGALYANKVFFDLSANAQESVNRTKWDLGFYTGGDWRVILNSSSAMMAKQIDKNDLNAVTAADTVGFSSTVIFNQSAPTLESLDYIDYPNGDLTRTAIAEISATDADNKVYIVNRGTGVGSPAPARGWKKIRIVRNAAGGYTLQHADIAATTFTSVDIPKSTDYFFRYASFENGVVEVEPTKNKWDLAWTFFSNTTNFGGEVPYTFQDIVLQNRNVKVAKVMATTKEYDAFTEADLASLTWGESQISIGADWRSGGGPSSGPAVRSDRYYIILDGDGNYYKLQFTGMTQAGERGFPAFKYVLLKEG